MNHSDLDEILKQFQDAGYLTHKGTNSYVLANIIVDYADRVVKEKIKELGEFSYWESDNLSLVSLLAFDRYRIYNMRTTPTLYSTGVKGKPGDKSYNGMCVGDDVVAKGKYHYLLVPQSQFKEKISLGVPYDELLSFNVVKSISDDKLFTESFMDINGVYIEQDYYIVPDIDGNSYLVLTDKFNSNVPITISFLTYSDNEPTGIKCKESIVVTCDYIRFITTELFSKFKILNRMSSKQLSTFLNLKYSCEVLILDNIIYIPSTLPSKDIKLFSDENVIPPKGYLDWIVKSAKRSIVYADGDLLDYLKSEIHMKVVPFSDFNKNLRFYVNKFYTEKYGLDGIDMTDEFMMRFSTDIDNGYTYYDIRKIV